MFSSLLLLLLFLLVSFGGVSGITVGESGPGTYRVVDGGGGDGVGVDVGLGGGVSAILIGVLLVGGVSGLGGGRRLTLKSCIWSLFCSASLSLSIRSISRCVIGARTE